jgi:hypothetical protein
MSKWFAKLKPKSARSTRSAPRLRTADAQMQIEAIGRLPQTTAEGEGTTEPAPEYIREAAEPSEDMWAHEQELYRSKQKRDKAGP